MGFKDLDVATRSPINLRYKVVALNNYSGFSLIELIISITLGSILMAAVLQFVFSSKKTFNLNEDVARIQENARVALDLLAQDIRMAGYTDDNNLPEYFRLDACTNSFDPCNTDGGSGSDRLAVQLISPDDSDCLGNTSTNLIANVYYVADEDADGISSLYCRGFDTVTNAFLSASLPMVDGIDHIQLLYGLVSSTGEILGYRNSTDMSTTDWARVRSVRLSLLVSNGQVSGSEPLEARIYSVLDNNGIVFTDQHLRKIFTTTIFLNNAEAGNGL